MLARPPARGDARVTRFPMNLPPRLLLRLACVSLFAVAARAAEPRLLKPDDFAALRDVGDPHLSPDGEWIVYTVRTTDLEKDKTATNLWIVKWDGSENRALTFGTTSQNHPRWSPDG